MKYGDTSTYLSVAALLLMGLLLVWAGVCYLNNIWNFTSINDDTYQITKLILSIFVFISAWYSFFRCLVTEGIVVMFTGISSTVFSLGSLLYGLEGLNRLDALFSIGIIMAALLFHRRNKFLGCASFILGLTMCLPYIFNYTGQSTLMGLGLLISGMLFMYYSLGNLLYGETGKNMLRVSQNRNNNSVINSKSVYVLTIVPGLLSFALLQILVGLQFILATSISLSYCFAEALLSLAIMIFAIYGLFKGIIAETIMMLIFAVSCFVFSFVALSGAYPSTVVDILMSVVLFATGFVFMIRKDYILGCSSLLFSIGGFAEGLFAFYILAGTLIIIAGLLSLYYSLDRWVVLETGYRLLSLDWIKATIGWPQR